MIGAVARDNLGLACVHARDFEGGLVGFSSAGSKEKLVQPLGQNFEEFRAQSRTRAGGITGRDVGKFPGLFSNRFNDACVFVAQVNAHQLRRKVEVALT